MYGRGWRFQIRKPIEVDINVNDLKLRTRDISPTGFFVEWLNCPLELNQEVNVTLYIDKQTLELKAGVVRLDSVGAGIAFRFLDADSTKTIKDWISKQES